ncbi:hypothetical protein [Rheinheimera pacifica]|uniref:hypothetical protein n=1 Tax=Rheinheimera pacifica TaxID=173990 RepID=UPI002EDBB039
MKYLFLLMMVFPFYVDAEDWINVSDMSQLRWQMAPNGTVYFRNLDQFNPEALACCYNYYIDTTTEAGKSAWSVILAKMATSGRLILGVANVKQAGPITYLGNW